MRGPRPLSGRPLALCFHAAVTQADGAPERGPGRLRAASAAGTGKARFQLWIASAATLHPPSSAAWPAHHDPAEMQAEITRERVVSIDLMGSGVAVNKAACTGAHKAQMTSVTPGP